MPLIKSGSRAAVSQNIREMMHAGHPQKQAIAAALSNARRYGRKAGGGGVNVGSLEARSLAHSGMIKSPVPGRTDKLPITVGGGAYVLPADHVAAVGQGNSMAGADILNKLLKMGPYATSGIGKIGTNLRAARTSNQKLGHLVAPPRFARGGSSHVPIVAAGGEFVVPPEKVEEIGSGDMARGHKILDEWVNSTRKKHIKTLRGLKPPKK